MPTENPHLVIPAKAGIQYLQARIWIPAIRYATAGMTNLLAGLIMTILNELFFRADKLDRPAFFGHPVIPAKTGIQS